MENNITTENTPDELRVEHIAKEHLKTAAKWGKFLAILGFTIIGLCILTILGAAIITPSASSLGALFLYIAGGAIYTIPVYYLYKFAIETQATLRSNSSDDLTDALGNLKSLFQFYGIATIIVLAAYAIILIFLLLSFSLSSF